MLISGFTFVRNIEKLNYPAKEAIESILPICDEFIVNVCDSEDSTLDIIKSINSDKIRIVKSPWSEENQVKGLILSKNTNVALNECKGKWCFYIQGDELLHEDDLQKVKSVCDTHKDNESIEGFVFDYKHFYGSYDVVASARNWYRREVRVVKNNISAESVGDAQGFRVKNRKPAVIPVDATIFHYGWVRPPKDMAKKNKHFFRLWHGKKYDKTFDAFEYEKQYGLQKFSGSHPKLMNERIKNQDWTFDIDGVGTPLNFKTFRFFLSDVIEKLTGFRIGEHKNFKIIRR
jgi:glycosyltransferase involved in cell wall biosynthesis